ncbi:hypothetical protein PMAYCL1PPCAC_04851, partial [Pristionchus mayeri]
SPSPSPPHHHHHHHKHHRHHHNNSHHKHHHHQHDHNIPSAPFYSIHSHRLLICILLLAANYFSGANTLAMSTAVVCMVNATLVPEKLVSEGDQRCEIRYNNSSSAEKEFAIPGTLDWSPSEQSLLVSARFYGGLQKIAFSGFVADRLGPDLVLTGTLLASSALTLSIPLLAYANFYVLVGSHVIIGGIESFHMPSVNCIASRWFPPGERTIASSIFTIGIQLSGGLSSLFAASLCRSSTFGGWPSIFYIFGGSCCIFTLAWAIFGTGGPSKNRWLGERERQFLDSTLTNKKTKKRKSISTRMLLASPLHSILLCNFSFAFSSSIMRSFLPLFLRDLGLPIDVIGWYVLSVFLSQIAGKMLLGPFIDFCTGKGFVSLQRTIKIAQAVGSCGSTVALMLLAVIPTCTNTTSALY